MKAEIRIHEDGDVTLILESQTALEMDAMRVLEEQNAGRGGIYIPCSGSRHDGHGITARTMRICAKPASPA